MAQCARINGDIKMVDISKSIQAKSDQLNADDLIGGEIIITITRVDYKEDSEEQPVIVHYQENDKRPYKPCKSMRRVLAALYGVDASKWEDKRLKLFRDSSVKWAGQEVGGVRISEASGITSNQSMSLQVTKGKKQFYVVKPLVEAKIFFTPEQIEKAITAYTHQIQAITDITQITQWLASDKYQWVENNAADRITEIDYALQNKQNELNGVKQDG